MLLAGAHAAYCLTVSGRVIDASARPLSSARVELVQAPSICVSIGADRERSDRHQPLRTSADHQGRFAFMVPEEGFWRLAVSADGREPRRWAGLLIHSRHLGDIPLASPGEPPERQDHEEDGWSASPAVEKEPPQASATRLGGRVVGGTDGQGVAGALVWLAGSPDCHTWTDSRGAFELAVPDAPWRQLIAAKAGFAAAATPVTPTAVRDGLRLTLDPAPAALAGEIVDTRGRPVTGARVQAQGSPFVPSLTYSDQSGRFRLEGLNQGKHQLQVKAPGFAPSSLVAQTEDPKHAGGGVRVVLHRPGVLSGRVVDRRERPLAGVRVLVEPAAEPALEGRSGEDGGFSVELHGSGPHVVTFEEEGYARVTRRADVPAGKDRHAIGEVVLPEAARLLGCVTGDAEQPVAGAKVYLDPIPQFRRLDAGGQPRAAAAAETAADGCFAIGSVEMGHRYGLEVWRRGYLPGVSSLVLAEPEQQVNIVLQAAIAVKVKVVGEMGEPVPQAEVKLNYVQPPGARRGTKPHARTGDDGIFVFEAVPPGTALLEVLPKGGYAVHQQALTIVASQDELAVTVVLREAAVLCGTVAESSGQPVTGADVEVVSPVGRGALSLVGALLQDRTGADGGFCLYSLPPGLDDRGNPS